MAMFVNHDARGGLGARGASGLDGHGGERLGEKDDNGQVGDCFLQRRIGIASVLPDLVGQRGGAMVGVYLVIPNVRYRMRA